MLYLGMSENSGEGGKIGIAGKWKSFLDLFTHNSPSTKVADIAEIGKATKNVRVSGSVIEQHHSSNNQESSGKSTGGSDES
jgi:hypothetical protein